MYATQALSQFVTKSYADVLQKNKRSNSVRQLIEVENPMVLGTIEAVNNVPTFKYIETDFRDIDGSLIVFKWGYRSSR